MTVFIKRCVVLKLLVGLVIVDSTISGDNSTRPLDHGAASNEVPLVEFESLNLPSYVDASVRTLQIPSSLRQLVGRRVRMRAFMQPPIEDRQFEYFSAVPEIRQSSRQARPHQSCAVPMELQYLRHSVIAVLANGIAAEWQTTRYFRPVEIEGVLHLEPDSLDLEFGGTTLFLEDATYRDVEPQEGYEPLWSMIGC